MLRKGRTWEAGNCYRRYSDRHEFQKRGDLHWGPLANLSATTGQSLGMRATVIAHLIPDVYAWLQHSKSCISAQRLRSALIDYATNNTTRCTVFSFGDFLALSGILQFSQRRTVAKSN